jgi:predicted ATP-binding protein involved in virulence
MRLEQLKIENFRGFESLTLRFHPEVTVLVGANGSGKTTVLEAVVLPLSNALYSEEEAHEEPNEYFSMMDARPSADPAKIVLTLTHRGKHGQLDGSYFPASGNESQDFGADFNFADPATLGDSEPIACYYDVNRHARDSTPGSRDAVHRTPRDAWKNAWNAPTGFREFFHWYREREDIENAERVEYPSYRDPQLEATRKAIESLLPGYKRPRIRRSRGAALVISKGGQDLAFDQLSGGERVLVALAGDIARRLAIANPESDDPLRGEGVVLIDEIDLHLHPEWQARVIPALRRTFPNVQLVVTTHSLIVLSYVPSECVRLLENFQLVEPPAPTEGREPNALASEVYGVPLRPAETLAEIDRVARLIHDRRLEDAQAGVEQLAQQLGDTDTDVVSLRTALALEEV